MRGSLVCVLLLSSRVTWAQASGDEVTVRGSRPADARGLGRAEVREVPGAFGDPFRAIETLPGVTPLGSGLPFFYVRGAPPGNVGYLLDGIRVPYLFHVLLGPSVVNPALVSRVELFPGSAPARFGRFAGGVVSGTTTAPADHAHGEAVVRLFDAGGLVETPFAGGRGVALVGGRYSYSALAFSLLSPSAILDYWDYQLRVAYRVTATGTVSVFAFGARDFLGDKSPEGGDTSARGEKTEDRTTVFDGQFHRLDLRYDDDHGGDGGHTRIALTLGLDRTGQTSDRVATDHLIGLRSLAALPLGGGHVVSLGADTLVESVNSQRQVVNDDTALSVAALLANRRDLSLGAHGEIALALGPLTVTPGLRLDLYSSTDTAAAAPDASGSLELDRALALRRQAVAAAALTAVEPRLAARVVASSRVRIFSTVGVAHQPPSFAVPVPGFQPSPLRGGLQRTVLASLGAEADLGAEITGSVVGFRSWSSNLSDALGTRPLTTSGPTTFDGRADGSSQGLELNVRRPLTRRLSGFASYTLSRSERAMLGARFLSNFDRTHVATGALAFDLGRGWRAGLRATFYTGIPQRTTATNTGLPTDRGRQPSFHRFDARLEKRWALTGRVRLAFVAEMLNATLQREALGETCDETGCRPRLLGPIAAPSVGLELVF